MAFVSTLPPKADPAGASQVGHLLAIETPLGPDVLLLTALAATETVSRGFLYTIEMLTLASDAEVSRLLGRPVTLWLGNNSETERRPLHGHIRHLTRLTVDVRGYQRWRAEIVPWMWFLTRSVDCRIYQHLSVPEILRSVFDEHGLSRYALAKDESLGKAKLDGLDLSELDFTGADLREGDAHGRQAPRRLPGARQPRRRRS